LRQEAEDEEERAAKALTYGSCDLNELTDKLREIVEEEGVWEPIIVQGCRVVPVDGTAHRRAAVKKLESKAYFSDTNQAVPAELTGMTATVGEVKGQRIASLKNAVVTNVKTNDSVADKKKLQTIDGRAQFNLLINTANFIFYAPISKKGLLKILFYLKFL
jgi:hypothetical protein